MDQCMVESVCDLARLSFGQEKSEPTIKMASSLYSSANEIGIKNREHIVLHTANCALFIILKSFVSNRYVEWRQFSTRGSDKYKRR